MGDPSFWEYFDVMVRNWYDAGDWAPLASTVAYGQVFTQTKVQKQDWQKGERCTVGPKKGETRNVIDYTKERLQTQTTTGLAEEWEPFDIPVGGWYDTSNWTPDPSTIPHGQAFTQTKTQRQNWRKGERCIVGPAPGTERNVVPYPRDQTITQSATGTQEIWNQVYWWTDWYPITDWEPADLSKVPVNTTVTQTMHFRRDQFMKEVSNLNNIRNDQTYIQSEFRSETRQAQGTQPLPTDATVKVKPKAPEVKVQNSQTKGGAQISVEDKK
ncbi:hypothetical protein AW736_26195 [Termitidicoccus mucosus]|uniref:Uncharacterized protein n=2 Tax=Termitidicoccus mucosus TaxID=1184151 RepID=A0A178IPS3_9BACT|nr:hypothetical protein AW736_26195 [Opitutaceae bacterium TSB47]